LGKFVEYLEKILWEDGETYLRFWLLLSGFFLISLFSSLFLYFLFLYLLVFGIFDATKMIVSAETVKRIRLKDKTIE